MLILNVYLVQLSDTHLLAYCCSFLELWHAICYLEITTFFSQTVLLHTRLGKNVSRPFICPLIAFSSRSSSFVGSGLDPSPSTLLLLYGFAVNNKLLYVCASTGNAHLLLDIHLSLGRISGTTLGFSSWVKIGFVRQARASGLRSCGHSQTSVQSK